MKSKIAAYNQPGKGRQLSFRMNTYFKALSCTLILSLTIATLFSQTQTAPQVPPGLDAYVNQVLQAFEVPAVSLAIVQNGKVLLTKGYGVKKLHEPDKVDAHTLFSIASNSKAFTATALAILVEEGKLKWDDPVIDHLPWFRMSDSYVTTHLTVRDLLVHHSGIPAYVGDLMNFPPSTFTRREILGKLKQIPLIYDFRTTYAYDNILYMAAGEVVAACSGMSWEDFVKTRIFDKLGMSESISRFSAVKNALNLSGSHKRIDGKIQVFNEWTDLNIGDAGNPAGGIMTNATDMAKWLITQLDSGRTPAKTKLFGPSSTTQLWKLVRPMPIVQQPYDLKPAQMDFYGYALGFRTYNYGKYKVVGHGGALGGFVSQVAMVPALNLGISVFTNQESASAYWAIIYHVLDYYMHNKPYDWLSSYKKQFDLARQKLAQEQAKQFLKRDTSARPSLAIDKYLGTYRDAMYGDVTLAKEDTSLVMRFKQLNHLVADVKHFQYDTFIATFRNKFLKADSYVTFSLNADGSIDRVKFRIIDPDSDMDMGDLLLRPVSEMKK
jgi:CubicO group peptidase (beta-lactamase class C family)